ncbi:MAG: hypothetical protein HUJ31_19375 [Pseudomonadales bacterium]|nr:hypothetical protein [Pseudomonadales bacterium]
MTDKLKESLSALLDGEASEIELHQLLRQFDKDESLKGSWMLYQQIRGVVRGDAVLSGEQHMTLHERISHAISTEVFPELEEDDAMARFPWFKSAAGLAVAASLVGAVFVGVQFNDPERSGPNVSVPVVAEQPSALRRDSDLQLVNVPGNDVMLQTAEAVAEEGVESFDDIPVGELRELDDEKQRRLRAYLSRHDRLVRMNPARMVIYDNNANK